MRGQRGLPLCSRFLRLLSRLLLRLPSPLRSTMKSSGLLKWLMIPVALLVLWVMIRVFSGGDGGTATGDRTPRLTPEEMRALGIEGDSPHDTVATLIGQVKQLRTEL